MSSDASSGTFWLGVGISLTGSLFSALGLAFQRLSHKRNNALPPEQQKSSLKQWMNLLGILFLFVEALFDLASFGLAPAAILTCIGAITLVFNMILAPMLCGETVSKRDVGVNAIVIVGTIVAVWFGPHETPDYTVQELLDLFSTTRFAVYITILLSCIGTLLVFWYALRDTEQEPKLCFRGRLTSDVTRMRLLRFTYPSLAGLIGGNTAVYAKAFIELCKTTVKGTNQFNHPGTYLMFVLMCTCVSVQLIFLNAGFKRYESLYIVPIYQVFFMVSGILGAMFYFNEVAQLSSLDVGMFSLGAGISMCGILLHSTREQEEEEECGRGDYKEGKKVGNDDDNDDDKEAKTKNEDEGNSSSKDEEDTKDSSGASKKYVEQVTDIEEEKKCEDEPDIEAGAK
mmetsp:Transcript_13690/g.20845  ORF Transcript_13690/g.20845 Transcript_13690/m.20845 type:complete len:399 (+) Transcript_13690:150-1346(+)|eukprot:CAMPEP_0178915832 /NCGR_PEP_ID=MMETSP0786-20121207/12265_1 /TAXON_ID=186022 /ORGANISM="Thalassionema frauenfeldii, Strain CCMP 1798" /LENGTH=398 /DNA_ID=CAMNT_0020589025 /DNA_START=129 /DNA_END=1325 /DNA_ORIENTATION=+